MGEHRKKSTFCNISNSNSLGDEYHVLFECDFFKVQRPNYYWKHCNTLKFASLLSNSRTKLLKRVSEFIAVMLRMFR